MLSFNFLEPLLRIWGKPPLVSTYLSPVGKFDMPQVGWTIRFHAAEDEFEPYWYKGSWKVIEVGEDYIVAQCNQFLGNTQLTKMLHLRSNCAYDVLPSYKVVST